MCTDSITMIGNKTGPTKTHRTLDKLVTLPEPMVLVLKVCSHICATWIVCSVCGHQEMTGEDSFLTTPSTFLQSNNNWFSITFSNFFGQQLLYGKWMAGNCNFPESKDNLDLNLITIYQKLLCELGALDTISAETINFGTRPKLWLSTASIKL